MTIVVHLAMADIDTYEFDSMARGYHQYQSIWCAVASIEDDGITSERGPLGRGSVDTVGALVGLKYFSSAIFKNARDSTTGCC